MRSILRWIGVWTLAAAFMALIVDGVNWLAARSFETTLLGEFIYWLSPSGLNTTQAVIERYTAPVIWDPVMISILNLPVWLAGGIVGSLLAFAGRSRHNPALV